MKTAKAVVAALATALALTLLLSVATFALQTADFGGSYKTGPDHAKQGDIIWYTVVADNSGEAVADVVLSDTIPAPNVFLPATCTYRPSWSPPSSCGPLSQLWQEDFPAGGTITTTFAVRVNAGTLHWDLENCAYLSWDDERLEMCHETLVNWAIFVPISVKNTTTP